MRLPILPVCIGIGIGAGIFALLPKGHGLNVHAKQLERKLEKVESEKAGLAQQLEETEKKLAEAKSVALESLVTSNAAMANFTHDTSSTSKADSLPQIPEPIITTERGAKKIVFPTLIGANGGLLSTNAEFRKSVGIRFVFKDAGGLIAFNARELHPEIFKYLDTSVEAAEKAQTQIDQRRVGERIREATSLAQLKEATAKAIESRAKANGEFTARQAQINAQRVREEAARLEAQRQQQAAAEAELRRARARGRHAVVAANRMRRFPF